MIRAKINKIADLKNKINNFFRQKQIKACMRVKNQIVFKQKVKIKQEPKIVAKI